MSVYINNAHKKHQLWVSLGQGKCHSITIVPKILQTIYFNGSKMHWFEIASIVFIVCQMILQENHRFITYKGLKLYVKLCNSNKTQSYNN